eukprot:3298080-Pleurochrysis_carterae.AAC.8
MYRLYGYVCLYAICIHAAVRAYVQTFLVRIRLDVCACARVCDEHACAREHVLEVGRWDDRAAVDKRREIPVLPHMVENTLEMRNQRDVRNERAITSTSLQLELNGSASISRNTSVAPPTSWYTVKACLLGPRLANGFTYRQVLPS